MAELGATYVARSVLTPTLNQLRALGEALGRLHRVVAGGRGPSLSPRHPAVAVPMTLARLDAVADRVPGEWAWHVRDVPPDGARR